MCGVSLTRSKAWRPVAISLAEAYVHPDIAWPRVVVDGGTVVALVMAFVSSSWEDDPADVRTGLWWLNVDQTVARLALR